MRTKLTRTFLVTTTSLALLASSFPAAYATPTSAPSDSSITTASTSAVAESKESTPANLPYRPLSDIRAEARAQGLSTEATELALELQRIVNAYHDLPQHLKDAPYDSPAVQDALLAAISPAPAHGATTRAVDLGKASGCARAVISTLVKHGTPFGKVWVMIEVIGGVTEFAKGVSEILKSSGEQGLQDLATKKWGKEFGFIVGRFLGYAGIVQSCKDLKI